MKSSIFLSLVLTLGALARAGPLEHNTFEATLGAFRSCLSNAGTDIDGSFFEFSSDPSSDYAFHNYQWELLNPVRNPAAYFLVNSAVDVQNAVRCGKPLGIPLVPKGGGHSYEKYSYTHTRGNGEERHAVIIDLQRLHSVSVDARVQQFKVGAGALLSQVAWPLYNEFGLVTPHGTCPTVGLTGLALGGGYGYLSRMYGLTTDSILELEMVTADGELVTVNHESRPDLFWAMKGTGSHSYGIVTRLTMKAYEPPKLIVFGVATYPKSQYTDVIIAWQRFLASNPPREINSKLALHNGLVKVEIFEVQTEAGQGAEGRARIEAYFTDFPASSTGEAIVYSEYDYPDFLLKTMHAHVFGITHPSQFASLTRHSNTPKRFRAKSFFVNEEAGEGELHTINEALSNIPVEQDIIIEMYAFGGAINDPENVAQSSFLHRNNALYLVQAFYEWRPSVLALDITASLDWLRSFFGMARGVLRTTTSYQNYADAELEDYLHRYFGTNLQRLAEVKRAVDPSNYFRGPQSIPLWY